MTTFEDDILASLATEKKDTKFEKQPEDADFSKFLPSDAEINSMKELSNKGPGVETSFSDSSAVVPIETTVIDPVVNRDVDYAYARKNLKEIIETSKSALDGIKIVAEATNHPRAYEVLTLLVNSVVDANKKLLDLHKQRQDLEIKEKELNKPIESTKVTNNNLFVGSSAQLLEFVKNLNKAKDEPDREQ